MAYHSVSSSVAILAPCTGNSRRVAPSNQKSPRLFSDSQILVASASSGGGCSNRRPVATSIYSRFPFFVSTAHMLSSGIPRSVKSSLPTPLSGKARNPGGQRASSAGARRRIAVRKKVARRISLWIDPGDRLLNLERLHSLRERVEFVGRHGLVKDRAERVAEDFVLQPLELSRVRMVASKRFHGCRGFRQTVECSAASKSRCRSRSVSSSSVNSLPIERRPQPPHQRLEVNAEGRIRLFPGELLPHKLVHRCQQFGPARAPQRRFHPQLEIVVHFRAQGQQRLGRYIGQILPFEARRQTDRSPRRSSRRRRRPQSDFLQPYSINDGSGGYGSSYPSSAG